MRSVGGDQQVVPPLRGDRGNRGVDDRDVVGGGVGAGVARPGDDRQQLAVGVGPGRGTRVSPGPFLKNNPGVRWRSLVPVPCWTWGFSVFGRVLAVLIELQIF